MKKFSIALLALLGSAMVAAQAPNELGIKDNCRLVPGNVDDKTVNRYETLADVGGTQIRDKATNLIWKTCPEGYNRPAGNTPSCIVLDPNVAKPVTVKAAYQYYESLPQTVKDEGWRIPNIKELGSLVYEGCANGIEHHHVFPQPPIGQYMAFVSSTLVDYRLNDGSLPADRAFILDGQGARKVQELNTGNAVYIRLVKDGPVSAQ